MLGIRGPHDRRVRPHRGAHHCGGWYAYVCTLTHMPICMRMFAPTHPSTPIHIAVHIYACRSTYASPVNVLCVCMYMSTHMSTHVPIHTSLHISIHDSTLVCSYGRASSGPAREIQGPCCAGAAIHSVCTQPMRSQCNSQCNRQSVHTPKAPLLQEQGETPCGVLKGHKSGVWKALNVSGRLWTGSSDSTIKVCSCATRTQRRMHTHTPHTRQVWDVPEQAECCTLKGHNACVTDLRYVSTARNVYTHVLVCAHTKLRCLHCTHARTHTLHTHCTHVRTHACTHARHVHACVHACIHADLPAAPSLNMRSPTS